MRSSESGGPAGYDAGKRIKGRKRHLAVGVDGTPIVIRVHEASVQDRDGAPTVILGLREKAPTVARLWADGGYRGPKLAAKRKGFKPSVTTRNRDLSCAGVAEEQNRRG